MDSDIVLFICIAVIAVGIIGSIQAKRIFKNNAQKEIAEKAIENGYCSELKANTVLWNPCLTKPYPTKPCSTKP